VVAGTLAGLVSLAYASPTDPTWITGIYDNADYDDVVAFLTDQTDASSGQVTTFAEQSAIAWTSWPKSDCVPGGTMGAEKSRAPPVKSCDGSIHLRMNSPVCRLTHARADLHPMTPQRAITYTFWLRRRPSRLAGSLAEKQANPGCGCSLDRFKTGGNR